MTMKTTKLIAALTLTLVVSCSDDAATPGDARPMPTPDAPSAPRTFKQVEVLARPGIAEALLISNNLLAAYNQTGPTFAGVDPAAVVAEAKTVLKAIYLGGCLLNGVLGLPAAGGVKPAASTCVEVGGAMFTENSLVGVNLKPTVAAAAQAYADRVFAQFVPDVMRIDMSIATSNYENVCGDPTMPLPLLCGGRFLDEDTIDITYDYLLNGVGLAGPPAAATGASASFNQVSALLSDGVNFTSITAQNKNNRTSSDASNTAQYKQSAVSTTFPYSANPL